MCNVEIKERMRIQGVRQWQIAEYIGMNESLLSRKMRRELDPDLKTLVIEALDNLGTAPGHGKFHNFETHAINK